MRRLQVLKARRHIHSKEESMSAIRMKILEEDKMLESQGLRHCVHTQFECLYRINNPD
jgi:hypothetical protein